MLEIVGKTLKQLQGSGRAATVARGAVAFLTIHVVGVGLSLGVHVMLARALGPGEYGTYAYAWNWMATLVLVGCVGLDSGSVRMVSAYAANEDWGGLRGFLRGAMVVVSVASVLVGFSILAVAFLMESPSGSAHPTFLVTAMVLPVHAHLLVRSQQLRGLKRVLASQIPVTIFQPLFVGIASIAGLNLVSHFGASEVMKTHLLSAALGSLALSLWLRKISPTAMRSAVPRYDWQKWTSVAGPLLVIGVFHVAMQRTGVLLVGLMLGERQAGIYSAASRISSVIAFGLLALSAWLAPMISELYELRQRRELQRLVRLSTRALLVVTAPLAAGVLLLADRLLHLFGSDFVTAHSALVVLALGQLVTTFFGPVGYLMTMTGNQRTAMHVLVCATLVNVALTVMMVPRFGILGAAIATATATTLQNLVLAVAVWIRLRIRSTLF